MNSFGHRRRIRSNSIIGFLIMGLLVVSGCTAMPSAPSLSKALPWVEENPEYIAPTSIAGNWETTQMYQQGKPTVRGFGGRFYFENKDHQGSIEVDGTVTVYIFDDENPDPIRQKPIRKFVFKPEQLPKHYSKTETGKHSYSFWIPWDEVGGPQRMMTLVIRFDGKKGEVVMSNGTRKVLPGTQSTVASKIDRYTSPYGRSREKFTAASANTISPIQQAAHRDSTNRRFDRDVLPANGAFQDGNSRLPSAKTNRLNTTTIEVPPSWGRGGRVATGSELDSSIIDIESDQNRDVATTLENAEKSLQNSSENNRRNLLNEFEEWQKQRHQNAVSEPSRSQFRETQVHPNTSASEFPGSRNRFGANDTKGYHQKTRYGAFADPDDWKTKAPAYSSLAARRDHFSRSRFRVRDSRIGRPRLGPGRSRPFPIGWPSDLQQKQQSNLTNAANLPATNEAPAYDSWQPAPEKRSNR